MPEIEGIYAALQTIRTPYIGLEADLHALVAEALAKAGYTAQHEAPLGEGCRVDFLVEAVAIEIKKGKPNRSLLLAQLKRYAASPKVEALIVVTERNVSLPKSLNQKPVRLLVLNRLWGVAFP